MARLYALSGRAVQKLMAMTEMRIFEPARESRSGLLKAAAWPPLGSYFLTRVVH